MSLLLHAVDITTGTASFGVKFLGFGGQVRSNHARLRAGGRSGVTAGCAAAMCFSYAMWVVHGIAHGDLVEVVSQGAGVVTTGVFLFQALSG